MNEPTVLRASRNYEFSNILEWYFPPGGVAEGDPTNVRQAIYDILLDEILTEFIARFPELNFDDYNDDIDFAWEADLRGLVFDMFLEVQPEEEGE